MVKVPCAMCGEMKAVSEMAEMRVTRPGHAMILRWLCQPCEARMARAWTEMLLEDRA